MFKGLCVCYAVVVVTYFSVAISGYWAFGNQADALLLSNFLVDGKALVPKWFILMTNMFTILQLSAVGVVRISLSCAQSGICDGGNLRRTNCFWAGLSAAY